MSKVTPADPCNDELGSLKCGSGIEWRRLNDGTALVLPLALMCESPSEFANAHVWFGGPGSGADELSAGEADGSGAEPMLRFRKVTSPLSLEKGEIGRAHV